MTGDGDHRRRDRARRRHRGRRGRGGHYWLPGAGASAARFYWESFRGVQQIFRAGTGDTVSVPVGCSIFPKENPRPSRRWAARRFTDIRYGGEPERGGHFAALEQPGLFLREVQNCFSNIL